MKRAGSAWGGITARTLLGPPLPMGTPKSSGRFRAPALAALLAGSSLLLGCRGGGGAGDLPTPAAWTMTITPAAPTLAAGQTLQFTASTPGANETLWSVVPTAAGSITAAGLFTAATAPGTATVSAVWSKDSRYAASTTVTILPPAPPAESTPGLAQASGAQQGVPSTGIGNAVVAGEAIPATTATTADGAIKIRHGFSPPAR